MTHEEQALFVNIEMVDEVGTGLPYYQRLVNIIADRIHAEFGLTGDHDFEMAESALKEADCGPEGAEYFALYEDLLRKKYAER